MKFNFAINFPTSLDTLTNPTAGQSLNSPDHATQHSDVNDAVEALEAKVGINSSAVTTSHDYKLSEVTSTDKAVGKTATQTLTNKTLTSPVVNVGSDVTGDIYYRNGSGAFTRLAIGSTDQILAVQSGIPAWISNPSAVDASYSTKGIIRFDTDATTSGVTVTSGVATLNTGTTANKIVKLNSSAQLPAVSGALLTNLPGGTYTNGTSSKDASDASTTQNIAHGLGTTPKRVKIKAMAIQAGASATDTNTLIAETVYNGTTQSSVSVYRQSSSPYGVQATTFTLNTANADSATQTGVVTFDSTNIIITWTKTGSPTGTYLLLWEAN